MIRSIYASGPQRQFDAFAEQVGYVVNDQLAANLVTLGIFPALFGVPGTISMTISGITVSIPGGAAMGSIYTPGTVACAWNHF